MHAVYRRKGSRFYYADVTVPNSDGGEPLRHRESTKQKARAAAMRYAADLEEKMRQRSGADGESTEQVLAVLEEAGRLARRKQLTVERGRELLRQMTELASGEGVMVYSTRGYFEQWLEDRRGVVTASSLIQYRAHIRTWLGWLGDDAGKRLETISRQQLTQFRNALKSGFRAPLKSGKPAKQTPRRGNAVNQVLRTVGSVLLLAHEVDGILLANPMKGVERLGKGDSAKRMPFSAEEVELLSQHAPSEEWRALMALGFYSGMRIMDAARLKWRAIDLAGGKLEFRPQKTRRKGDAAAVEIPIHPRLAAALKELPAGDDPDAYVLPELSQKIRRDLCVAFGEIMEAAGVERQASKGEHGEKPFRAKSFHSFRHALASAMAAEDVSEELRMKVLGQSSIAVHRGYTHHQLEQLRGALEKVA